MRWVQLCSWFPLQHPRGFVAAWGSGGCRGHCGCWKEEAVGLTAMAVGMGWHSGAQCCRVWRWHVGAAEGWLWGGSGWGCCQCWVP